VPIQYLVPCTCGRKIPVETRQAGGEVACECGASIAIPRLLELKTLEKVAVQAAEAKPRGAWGIGHGLIASAAVLLVGVIALSVLVFIYAADDPYESMTPDQIRENFQKLTPMQTWGMWMNLQQAGINPPKKAMERYFEGLHAQRQMLLTFLGIAAAVDIAILAAGIFIVRQSRLKRTPRANI
jgi:hypothetical protein